MGCRKEQHYEMSFTVGGLLCRESVMLAERYLTLGDWVAVRQQAVEENLLQVRTRSSLMRMSREIVSRLKMLDTHEIQFLINASGQDQGYLMWVAVCRRYPFIYEFSLEVLRENYISLRYDLGEESFGIFFDRKADWHPELEAIKPTTRNKLRQNLFRMLREAELIGHDRLILAALPSPDLVRLLIATHEGDLRCLPIFDADVRRLMR